MNQLFQQLLTPDSDFARNGNGVNIALVRLEDFVREQVDPAVACQSVERLAGELASALEGFATNFKGKLLFGLLPPSGAVPETVAAAIARAAFWRRLLSPCPCRLRFCRSSCGLVPAC